MLIFLGIDIGSSETEIVGQSKEGKMFYYSFPSVWGLTDASNSGIQIARNTSMNVSEKYSLLVIKDIK